MIRLGKTDTGKLLMGCNHPLPADIERVEYYRDQKLFVLKYENIEEDDLMPYEMSPEVAEIIKSSPDIIIIAMAQPDEEPYEYIVPLVQIGL